MSDETANNLIIDHFTIFFSTGGVPSVSVNSGRMDDSYEIFNSSSITR